MELNTNTLITLYDGQEKKELKYSNQIELLKIFKVDIGNGPDIKQKIEKDGKIILKRVDNTQIEIENLDNETLRKILEEKVAKSYKKLYEEYKEEDYRCTYLTTSNIRSGISKLSSSPIDKDLPTIFLELKVDENGELDKSFYDFLKSISEKELTDWINTFFTVQKENYLIVVYDSKIMIINNDLIKYIKNMIDTMEETYMSHIEEKDEIGGNKWRI